MALPTIPTNTTANRATSIAHTGSTWVTAAWAAE